jgi:hypothetical protein
MLGELFGSFAGAIEFIDHLSHDCVGHRGRQSGHQKDE